jgi:hypothetical protein
MTEDMPGQAQFGDEEGPEPNPEPPADRQAENWGRHDREDDDDGHVDSDKSRRRT